MLISTISQKKVDCRKVDTDLADKLPSAQSTEDRRCQKIEVQKIEVQKIDVHQKIEV